MGYWPSVRSRWLDIGQVLFLCVYGPRRSRGPQTRKKRTRPISSHLDRTNLVNKRFILWLLVKFCLRDAAGSSEQARSLHLARLGSQSQHAIWFILPARGASHIIIIIILMLRLIYKPRLALTGCWTAQSCFPDMRLPSKTKTVVNIKNHVTLMSAKLGPAIWLCDTGQQIPCFDRCQ